MFDSPVDPLREEWMRVVLDEEPPAWLDEYDRVDERPWTDADALAAAVSRPPGSHLLSGLEHVDVAGLTADEAVEYAQQVNRLVAHVAGLQATALAAVNERLIAHFEDERAEVIGHADRAERGSGFMTAETLASAELAPALRLPPTSMDIALDHARDLAGPMLPLRDALDEGLISGRHADVIARELSKLPLAGNADEVAEYAAQCARILDKVLPYAATHTAPQAARRTKALVLVEDPRGADERRRDSAEREHGVWLTPTENGSCEITAVLPLLHGTAVMHAIDTLAKDPRFETSAGCVTKGQHRVAALVTLMLGDPGSVATVDGPVAEAKVKASVNVIVPLETLLTSDIAAPGGTVAGEPVTADTLRDLVVDLDPKSTLRRLVTDSTGCILDAGRTRYAISDTQRHLITLRDGRCRFPGCHRPAERCEVDHAKPWDRGGCTDLCNLGPLCKHHHQLKTFGGWTITDSRRTGACTWRSPLGRIYHHDPPELVPRN